MIIEFSVENFLSFKEKTTLSMIANESKKRSLYDPSHPYKLPNKTKVLPIMAIYGKNASGKSNLIKAMRSFINFILDPPKNISSLSDKFLFDDTQRNKPTKFEIEFYVKKIDTHLKYEIDINGGNNIIREVLSEYNNRNNQFDIVYYRVNKDYEYNIINGRFHSFKNNNTNFNYYFNLAYDKVYKFNIENINPITTDNIGENTTLLYTVSVYLNNRYLSKILDYFNSISFTLTTTPTITISDIAKDNIIRKINTILKDHDTSVDSVGLEEVEEPVNLQLEILKDIKTRLQNRYQIFKKEFIAIIPNGYYITYNDIDEFKYYKMFFISKNKKLQIEKLSDGTKRLIELIDIFNDFDSDRDYIYIVDELERSLHPNIVQSLIKIFLHKSKLSLINSQQNNAILDLFEKDEQKNNNSENCIAKHQLIFTTHSVEVLDIMQPKNERILRIDEVSVIERGASLESEIYRLDDFSNIEYFAKKNLRRAYLQSYFGGTPHINTIDKE